MEAEKAQSRTFAFVIMTQPKDRRNAANESSVDTSSQKSPFVDVRLSLRVRRKQMEQT